MNRIANESRACHCSYIPLLHPVKQIHQYMSGRIKILKGGVPVSSNDSPALGYSYDVPGTFDIACGTFGLDAFQLPNSQCPDHFVCNADQGSSSLASYSACIDAMNCAMMDGMTTGVTARSEDALFVHQMIPHHQNAVNMAKATLIVSTLSCRNITNQDDPDCVLEMILRDIINSQNHQIQLMRNYLTAKGLPQTDNCLVRVETVSIGGSTYNSTSGSASANSSLTGAKNSPRKSGVVAQASHAIIVLLFAMAAVLLL